MSGTDERAPGVSLRPWPYPFKAMLAVCSDLDETPGFGTYFEIAKYLNSTEETSMGPGVGLEVGNTLFFDMAPREAAYWNGDEDARARLRLLMRSGHIDCIHSFGDLATTRKHAGRALEELDRHGCRLAVWIDHAVAPTNFGPDIMRGTGDLPGAPAYHADLTVGYGIRYVWCGRVTSVTGQDVPRRLGGILEPRHPLASSRTLAKEAVKGLVGRLGASKYAMHAPNRLLRPARLRDGQPVIEFLRANPCWAAVDRGETADGFAEVATPAMLARLVSRGGLMVLYTHLGKVRDPRVPFGPATRRAFERLADEHRAGRILVTTTRRLLDFAREREEARWECSRRDGVLQIDVRTPGDGSGLTFAVDDPEPVRLVVNGRLCEARPSAAEGSAGERVIGVPWPRLEWPRP
jgi:hypothetical protein